MLEERALNPEWARFGRGPAFCSSEAASSLSPSACPSDTASTRCHSTGDAGGGETQWIDEGECEWMIGNHCDEVRCVNGALLPCFARFNDLHSQALLCILGMCLCLIVLSRLVRS